MKKNDRLKKRIARLVTSNYGPGDMKITIEYAPEFTRVPTEAEARRAAAVVQRFCNNRQSDTACGVCPIQDICGTEPYSWVLPCTDCGKDSEPRIKCRYKGPVCVACCEACHNAEPFPCLDYDDFRKRVINGDL